MQPDRDARARTGLKRFELVHVMRDPESRVGSIGGPVMCWT